MFRPVEVRDIEHRTSRLLRVRLGGPELSDLDRPEPAASVRLLLPADGSGELELPVWNGNEFRLADGRRPTIRTFTPRRYDRDQQELDVEVVLHEGGGAASAWARRVAPGDRAAVSGPGRGYAIDPAVERFLVAGDETAIPAIDDLVGVIPPRAEIEVHIEVAEAGARLDLIAHPGLAVAWHVQRAGERPGERLVAAVTGADIGDATAVWAAGEAAAVQRVRRHLFEERGMPRSQATIRGYWKHGRTAGEG